MSVLIDGESPLGVEVDFLCNPAPADEFDCVYIDRWAVHNPIFRSDLEFGIYASMLCDTHPVTDRLIFLQKKASKSFNFPIRIIKQIVQDMVDEGIFVYVEDCYPHLGGVELRLVRSYRHPPPGLPRLPPRETKRERISASVRSEVFSAAGGMCTYCRSPLTRTAGPRQFHVDHRTALARGGSERRRNLVAACATCNLRKGVKRVAEFMAVEDAL